MTVSDFIDDKQNNQRAILEFLHEHMMSFPEIEDKIRFKIPFYYRKTWICYLNPVKNDGIELAFVRAKELSNENGLLDFKDRVQVAGVTYYDVKEIQLDLLDETIHEAILLDEIKPYTFTKKKSKKK